MRSVKCADLEFTLVSTLLRSGTLDFDGFLMLMGNKNRETDIEIHYKDTFRAFSKDDDGANLILLTKFTIILSFYLYRMYSCGGTKVCHESSTWKGKPSKSN